MTDKTTQSAFRRADGSAEAPIFHLLPVPSDPFYAGDAQWHLGYVGSLGFSATHSSGASDGLERVWSDYQGDGVRVGIWDDGVQKTHWDLQANYDATRQVTVNGLLNNGQPLTVDDGHGTSVAGLIAGDDNSRGGVGLAFDASLTAVRIFGGADDINSAWSRYLTTLDSLSRFDVTNHSYGAFPNFVRYADVAKFEAAAVNGRGGLGTVNVKSAGNDNVDGNGEALDASRFTVTVAALSATPTANVASYSTYGAHVLVSAPAASVTTDLLGSGAGYDGLLSGDYTNRFGGTSAAGPVTAGVIALMLDANANLGWRDVQNILAYSALGVGSLYSGATTNENFAWKWNGADTWNGGGLHYSEDYGYGMVNAFTAVRMAEVWNIFYPVAATSANEVSASTGTITASKTIADLSTLDYRFNVSSDIAMDHVTLAVSLSHTYFTDLRIRLISPQGTVMSLYDGSTGDGSTADRTFSYAFEADGYRGESSAGTWTLQIEDAEINDVGKLRSVAFKAFGSVNSANDVYHYTSEVLQVLGLSGQSDRQTLSDSDGGSDWIDAAAMTGDLDISLVAGASSSVGGTVFLQIAAGSVIENLIGGDGNDHLTGNAVNNVIYGMRGDDVISGGQGDGDVAGFRGSRSSYVVTTAHGVTTVVGPDGTDTLTGIERLRFDDGEIADPSVLATDTVAPALRSSTPADGDAGVAVTADLRLDFSEPVKAGSGYVTLYRSDGTLVERFDIAGATISGSTVTCDFATTLAKGTAYYVLVGTGAILDLADNPFAGIAQTTALDFATERDGLILIGDKKANTLVGSARDDTIDGQAGNDVLSGGFGNDILIGGAGRDTFVFDTLPSASNVDVIKDFNTMDDTIRLDRSIFDRLTTTGTLAAGNFAANAGAVAADANDYILFDTGNGRLYYDADGNGAGLPVCFGVLESLTGRLTPANFVVI